MLFKLPEDVCVSILGGLLSLKCMLQLDSAICCKERNIYLELLKLLKFEPEVSVKDSTNARLIPFLSARQIELLSMKLELKKGSALSVFSPTQSLRLLRSLSLSFHFENGGISFDDWELAISTCCPKLQNLQLCYSGPNIVSLCPLSILLNQCSELSHFSTFHIEFPQLVWTDLHDRQLAFLCVSESRAYINQIIDGTGPLPEAVFHVQKYGERQQKCVWNKLLITEATKLFATFLPDTRLRAASFEPLCRGASVHVFKSFFQTLELVKLHNCEDMDEQTFTVLLQQPLIQFVDLHHNHTIRSLAPNTTRLGRYLKVVELDNFTALSCEIVQKIEKDFGSYVSVFCTNMSQISLTEEDLDMV